jgi:uncharacterized protein YjbJ (UPF0337 family)
MRRAASAPPTYIRRNDMANQETLEGTWNEVKGKLRRRWGQLTDSDLPQAQGSVDELVGIIQRKTGEGREVIENYVREITSGVSGGVGAAADRMRQYAQRSAAGVEQVRQQAVDQMRAGYDEAQRMVRDQPGLSLGVTFGAGILAGVLLGLFFRSGD